MRMENRFKSINNGEGSRKLECNGSWTKDDLFQDTVTGVVYLQSTNIRGTAIVPLIDKDGKPLTQPVE